MAKVRKKVNEIKKEIKQIRYMAEEERQAAQIEQANAMIIGIAEYYKTAICSNALNYIDDQINKSLYRVFRKKYGKNYRLHKVPLNDLSNRPQRHKGYQSQTFAIKCAGMHIGITKAFLTHSQWLKYPFNQKITPYTVNGRKLFQRASHCKTQPSSRPPLYDIKTLQHSKENALNNFEYYMNREYAYNRDKGKCKICGRTLNSENRHCHRAEEKLPVDKINKVQILYGYVKNAIIIFMEANYQMQKKVIRKIQKYRLKLLPRD